MIRRLIFLLIAAISIVGLMVVFSYDIIKFDWVSMMEIQSSYRPMEDPLPVPAASIPIDGAAYIPGTGAPVNPVTADDVSIKRGEELYIVNCIPCHGKDAKGTGVIGTFFQFKPADLTTARVQQNSDGAIFLVISNGVEGRMPALNENFNVRERWDLVNYIRTIASTGNP